MRRSVCVVIAALIPLLILCHTVVGAPRKAVSSCAEPETKDDSPRAFKPFGADPCIIERLPDFARLIAGSTDPWQKHREEMLAFINRDRKSNGLGPVALDRFASYFAQIHADEMAKYDYLSHWALDGTKPYVRWSRLGGMDHIAENVGFFGVKGADITKVLSMKTFQENFMDSPGHRANILEPQHNFVGLGVAVNREAGSAYVAQEFVDRYVGLYAFSREAKPGQQITLAGRMLDRNHGPYACAITHEPVPRAMTPEQLRETGPYEDFGATKLPLIPPWKMQFDKTSGNFWIPIVFPRTSGLYYVTVFVRDRVDSIPYSIGRGARISTEGAIAATSIVFEIK